MDHSKPTAAKYAYPSELLDASTPNQGVDCLHNAETSPPEAKRAAINKRRREIYAAKKMERQVANANRSIEPQLQFPDIAAGSTVLDPVAWLSNSSLSLPGSQQRCAIMDQNTSDSVHLPPAQLKRAIINKKHREIYAAKQIGGEMAAANRFIESQSEIPNEPIGTTISHSVVLLNKSDASFPSNSPDSADTPPAQLKRAAVNKKRREIYAAKQIVCQMVATNRSIESQTGFPIGATGTINSHSAVLLNKSDVSFPANSPDSAHPPPAQLKRAALNKKHREIYAAKKIAGRMAPTNRSIESQTELPDQPAGSITSHSVVLLNESDASFPAKRPRCSAMPQKKPVVTNERNVINQKQRERYAARKLKRQIADGKALINPQRHLPIASVGAPASIATMSELNTFPPSFSAKNQPCASATHEKDNVVPNRDVINQTQRGRYAGRKLPCQVPIAPSSNFSLSALDASDPISVTSLLPVGLTCTNSSSFTEKRSRPGTKRNRPNVVTGPHDDRMLILPQVSNCKYCDAIKFYRETPNFCCSSGQVSLVETILPEALVTLLTAQGEATKDFHKMIRTYNNHFAFSSMSIHCDEAYERRNRGIYTVRVQGQVHHFLNDLVSADPAAPLSGMQFYFFDPQYQSISRSIALPRLSATTLSTLVGVMEENPYSQFLRSLSTLEELDDYRILIKADSTLDQRVYNKPSSSEVAGVWIEDATGSVPASYERNIRVYARSGQSHHIQFYYACYDPLQYVLMFPYGEPGWHGNIPTVGSVLVDGAASCSSGNGVSQDFPKDSDRSQPSSIPSGSNSLDPAHMSSFHDVLTNEEAGSSRNKKRYKEGPAEGYVRTSKRPTVTCRQYYAYKLQQRPRDRSYLLRFGRLLQQYVVDMYIKIESMRLAYFQNNQDKMRVEHYKGVMDSVISGVRRGGTVGTRVYLPATFIGGPRDMRHRYLDSMSLVQHYGTPDLFFTITCNSNWPEIKECLEPGEEVQNRPDLVARVFKAKLAVLQDRITKDNIFGEVASMVHVIEFQKRGLPHAHFLIILKPGSKFMTPAAYDRFVSAELPDKDADPYLYGLVVKHMMHGPCGVLKPDNVCMKEDRCKNKYPKKFSEQTLHGKGSYPIYRRKNDGRSATVRGEVLDNRWVVPYNPTLLAEFNCHLNVEICCDIRVVKYLYKYVHKGHDKVSFRISPEESGGEVNEIENFRNARWVSPPEAVWRIYGFPLSSMSPSVMQLQVHLPNFQNLHFEDNADLEELIRDERSKRSMLTEFFRMNAEDPEAKRLNCLYKEFPTYFVWNPSRRRWTRRRKGVVIGRLCTVNPCEDERYYLRVLLVNVRGPTSFTYLLTIDGVTSSTNQEAAYKRGLLHQDDDINNCMEEACTTQMAPSLRMLFATLLYYCKPSKPQELFAKFYTHMAEDIMRDMERLRLSDSELMHKVLLGINDTLKSLGKQVDDYHIVPFSFEASDTEQLTREVTSERTLPVPEADLDALHLLNAEQRNAFNILHGKAMSDEGGAFFVDGPGGTGKTFLYKVLLAHIRSKGCIALVVATSGIASSCFLGGRTAHSRFKIPIDISTGVKCQVSFQSGEAYLIRSAKIIIWDEAPMANKAAIEALDKLLQDLCKDSRIFGGKLVVFGGDFRQVLPVIRGGNRMQQVNASMISSLLWKHMEKLKLTINMRAREDPGFIDFLMRVGNGEEKTNDNGEIQLPLPMVVPYTNHAESLEALISYVYPDLAEFSTKPFEMMKRVILSPKNDFVDDINSMLIDRMTGDARVYVSDDRAKNVGDQGDYLDYLNSLEPKGLPQHRLILKPNCPVVLLRNINPVEGLCNGTRLICTQLHPHVVGAVIATGQFIGKHVWIPRIPLEPNPGDNKYLIPFVRRQFPLRLCFAMTINKAQGQTLDFVGLYLRQPVFSHGQLYVALSRARTGANVKVLILPPVCDDEGTRFTRNVVYMEVLAQAGTN